MKMPRYIQCLSTEMERKRGFASVSVRFNDHFDDQERHWKVSAENAKTGAWTCHLIPESVCRRYKNSSPEAISARISEMVPPLRQARSRS